jgi:hypothetical protein
MHPEASFDETAEGKHLEASAHTAVVALAHVIVRTKPNIRIVTAEAQ